jgi:hypothetical protein
MTDRTMHGLDDVRREVERLAAMIGADERLLPTYGASDDGARPHVERRDGAYHWVVVEPGCELERVVCTSLAALLERVFAAVTFALATRWELRHRKAGQDFRRELFRHQLELLHRLDPAWAAREGARHEAILRRHPFVDGRD